MENQFTIPVFQITIVRSGYDIEFQCNTVFVLNKFFLKVSSSNANDLTSLMEFPISY